MRILQKSITYIKSLMHFTSREYCKFRNFRENFIFTNRAKRHIRQVKNSPLGHDLPTSVNGKSDFTSVLFSRNFSFAKFRKNKTLTKISEFTVWRFCMLYFFSPFLFVCYFSKKILSSTFCTGIIFTLFFSERSGFHD